MPDVSTPEVQDISAEAFRSRFQDLIPLMLKEWPNLDRAALEETLGDLDKAINLISDLGEQSRTRVRRTLGELSSFVTSGRAANEMERVLSDLERRTEALMEKLRAQIPDVREKARENIGASLLFSLVLGLFLGVLLGRRVYRGND